MTTGDTACGLGAYALEVRARHYCTPLHVVAMTSTVGRAVASGAGLAIEERNPDEVKVTRSGPIMPNGIGEGVWRP